MEEPVMPGVAGGAVHSSSRPPPSRLAPGRGRHAGPGIGQVYVDAPEVSTRPAAGLERKRPFFLIPLRLATVGISGQEDVFGKELRRVGQAGKVPAGLPPAAAQPPAPGRAGWTSFVN